MWSAWTASPVGIDRTSLPAVERDVLARCGAADAGLRSAALAILGRKERGASLPEADGLSVFQRAAGEPHPWGRLWVASGRFVDDAQTMTQLDAWLKSGSARPALRRCGVGYGAGAEGTRTLVVLTVEALADLSPLPTRARPGEWLTVEARLRVAAQGGEVLVVGPSGLPRVLPTSFDGRVLRARFAPDRPGEFALQVVADVAGGPRPVLEATVFAGVEPQAGEADQIAPGEGLADGHLDDGDCVAAMIAAARASEGLAALARDPLLDAVSRQHAASAARSQVLAHDVGDGDPVDRLRAAGVDAYYAGENVAHASTIALAHRSLWASPSHRANLLRREFARVGVGVARDEHGGAWIVETFTSAR